MIGSPGIDQDVPNYVRLYESGELARRVEVALASLERCRVCPWDCDVDRLQDHKKVCRTGRHARVASYFPHVGEEDCLRGQRCVIRRYGCLPSNVLA